MVFFCIGCSKQHDLKWFDHLFNLKLKCQCGANLFQFNVSHEMPRNSGKIEKARILFRKHFPKKLKSNAPKFSEGEFTYKICGAKEMAVEFSKLKMPTEELEQKKWKLMKTLVKME